MNEPSSRPRQRSNKSSGGHGRFRALQLGLPAAITALIGVSALLMGAIDRDRQEARYKRWADDAHKERLDRTKKLNDTLLQLQATSSNQSLDSLIPPTDERRVELERVTKNEKLYWSKLIAMNASSPEYRYKFASVCLVEPIAESRQMGLSLMNSLAPAHDAGYPEAHLWMIDYLAQQVNAGRIQAQAAVPAIFTHAGHAIKGNQQKDLELHQQALKRKAETAVMLQRHEDALEAYTELFETDPYYFGNLVAINSRLDRPKEVREAAIAEVLRQARTKFESRLQQEAMAVEWTKDLDAWLTCTFGLKEYDVAVARLNKEIEQLADKHPFRRLHLEQSKARALVAQIRNSNASPGSQFTQRDVQLAAEAYHLDPKNLEVLLILVKIGLGSDLPLAEKARQIYDAEKDPDPPAIILLELGTVALAKQDYDGAVMHLERSRQKDPRDVNTLNNLAYVYLVSNRPNPDRALRLVEDALRNLPNQDAAKSKRTFLLDTRAMALMQLNRIPEAIASFELALQDRPTNRKILEALIKCYEISNLSADDYKKQLAKLDQATQETE